MTDDVKELEALATMAEEIREQVGRNVVGQRSVLDELLICVLARGHCILEGVPGLAKTLLVHTFAECSSLAFTRIQFTPDLMPSDITGTEVLREDRGTGERDFHFMRGPIFANIVLADEVNRAPPKTQAALLEGMQERQVSAGGQRYPLPAPFFVLATMNPIEQEGTYPLPEAQLDRFMIKALVQYPSPEEERAIYRLLDRPALPKVDPVVNAERLLALQDIVRRLPISDYCLDYAMALVRATRHEDPGAPDFVQRWVTWGAGPRAGQTLVLAAKARAALNGRPEAEIEDIRGIAPSVLRHRLVLNYNAEAENQTPDSILQRLIEETPVHRPRKPSDGRVEEISKS